MKDRGEEKPGMQWRGEESSKTHGKFSFFLIGIELNVFRNYKHSTPSVQPVKQYTGI
jgi:hypothetical protein